MTVKRFNMHRCELLKCLPCNDVVCELGVSAGWYSERILDLTNPRICHLVDFWEPVRQNAFVETQADKVYEGVKTLFKSQISKGQVFIHKEYSQNATYLFAPNYFDWIYIDADHSYDAVINDLKLYYPLVKEDGFIMGHDYVENNQSRQAGFGVVQAVADFVKITNSILVGITNEEYASFIICKKDNPNLKKFLENLKENGYE